MNDQGRRMTPEQDERVWQGIHEGAASHPRRRPRRFGRFRAPLIVSGIAAVAIVGAAAWVTLAPTSVSEHQVACYERAALDSHSSLGQDFPSDEPDKAGRIALDECRALWAAGAIGSSSSSGSSTREVPALELCLTSHQTFAVFPNVAITGNSKNTYQSSGPGNEKFCDDLGLLPAP